MMRNLTKILLTATALLLGGCVAPVHDPKNPGTEVTVQGKQILINNNPVTLFGFRVGSASLREDWTNELIAQLPLWRTHGVNSFTLWLQGTSGAHHRLFADDGSIATTPSDIISRAGYGLVEVKAVVGRESGSAIIQRTRRIVEAADRHGMVVVIGIGYRSSWHKTDTVDFAERAMAAAAAPFKTYRNVIINVWNETNTKNALEIPQAINRYVRAIRGAAPGRLVCAGSLRSEMNIELAKQVDMDLFCQDAGRNLPDTLAAYETLRPLGKPVINVESYGGNGGGYVDDLTKSTAVPAGYSVMFSAKGGWQRIFGAWEENDYQDGTGRPLMGKKAYRELIRYVGRDGSRQTHLLVHVAGWFQGASRVEHAQHLGDRTSPNQWNNVFIPGHGIGSGDTSAPGIRWLLKEIQDARQLSVKN